MKWKFEEIIKKIINDKKESLLLKGKWGIEKEALRVNEKGQLSKTLHPIVFGDKIKNTRITTDFSESQLELITPPFDDIESAYYDLKDLQKFVQNNIGNEYLWPLSMPCILPNSEEIPIAHYNKSEDGNNKELYRKGLGYRYGKKMQTISGIHYNFSFSDDLWNWIKLNYYKNESKKEIMNDTYFSLARNFLRYRWFLIYLYGASPNFDDSYADQAIKAIEKEINTCKICKICTCILNNYADYATSIRTSRLGYSGIQQDKFRVSYNNVEEYVRDIKVMLSTNCKEYENLNKIYGEDIQVNTNVLQSYNEYYSPIRFKNKIYKDEEQLDSLYNRGVEYLEIRTLDIDPYESTGIGLEQLYFLQVFMLYCLFESSDVIDESENEIINRNHHLAALIGRKENLEIYKSKGETVFIEKIGKEILDKMLEISKLMDSEFNDKKYENVILSQYKKIENKEMLISSRIIDDMKKDNNSFIEFGLKRAKLNKL